MVGMVARDQLVGNLLDRLDDMEERIRILEATHPGLPGEAVDTLAYYRPEDGSLRTPSTIWIPAGDDLYIGGFPVTWSRLASAHMALPALRAFWSMSSVDYQQPECTDISGHGHHLQAAAALGNVFFRQGPANTIAPSAGFGGAANQYLFRADGGAGNWADVTGGEGYILPAQRGLTLGGCFYWAALPGAVEVVIGKGDFAVNQQYLLYIIATNHIRLSVWPGAISVTSAATISTGWNHCIGVYDQPSQTLYVELNGVITAGGAGAAPAALADTAGPFVIGADGAGGNRFTGYASMCTLQACSMYQGGTFEQILALREQTRVAFGV